jgi:NAD(P)-dependent dehydrogenase (short-subunit alcohol dehydrogenase family)
VGGTRAIGDFSDRSLAELISLVGRTAVVTGAARGIGNAIARRLAEAGANVVIADLNEAEANRAAAELADRSPAEVWAARLDVTDSVAVGEAAERAVERGGSLDVWVNAAGIYPLDPFLEMADGQWDRILDVNLRGSFVGAREAARRMVAGGRGGVIINIASITGYRVPNRGIAHYVSSKHAVIGLTKSLAVELGAHGVRALAIAPAAVMTPGMRILEEEFAAEGGGDFIEMITERVQLGRAAVPDDVARVALFCAGDMSAYMTGSTLAVDGGDLAA